MSVALKNLSKFTENTWHADLGKESMTMVLCEFCEIYVVTFAVACERLLLASIPYRVLFNNFITLV